MCEREEDKIEEKRVSERQRARERGIRERAREGLCSVEIHFSCRPCVRFTIQDPTFPEFKVRNVLTNNYS